jgi:hypothetical protein
MNSISALAAFQLLLSPLTAIGSRLVHQIDGQVFCDVEDTDPAAPRRGTIVFGNAGATTVDFKDLQLKRLSLPR